MKSLKKYQAPIIMIAIAAIVFGLFWLLQKPKMILFFSNSCPHCKIVEQYISDNNIDAKIKFQKLEVSQLAMRLWWIGILARSASPCPVWQ